MIENRRNLLVGVTVIVAVIILGGMILVFRELPSFMRIGYEVRFVSHDTGGVMVGSDVLLAGIRIGRISRIDFAGGDARKGVTITATIDRDVSVPGDVNAYFQRKGFAGGAAIEFRSDGKPPGAQRRDPITNGPLAWLPKDDGVTIEVAWVQGGDGLLPAELVTDVREAAGSFRRLADTLNTFFTPPPAGGAQSAPAGTTRPKPPANLYVTLAKLDAVLDAVGGFLGDEENQANFKNALAGLNAAAATTVEAMNEFKAMSAGAKTAMADISVAAESASRRFDELVLRLIDDADRMGKVLTSLHRTAESIEKGRGTAGKMINDPALYENLVSATSQLKAALNALQELIDTWKEQGIEIRVK